MHVHIKCTYIFHMYIIYKIHMWHVYIYIYIYIVYTYIYYVCIYIYIWLKAGGKLHINVSYVYCMYVHIFLYIHVTHIYPKPLQVVAAATTASLYDLSARDINGQLVPLSFEGGRQGRQGNWGQPIGWVPSGKLTKNYGKSLFYSWVNPLFLWAIFHSYVSLPEGMMLITIIYHYFLGSQNAPPIKSPGLWIQVGWHDW